jgi:nucleoside-diphosphate-sugar epimerase
MANCFVTGGSGFVGTHLADRLLREGNRLWCLSRRREGHLVGDKAIAWVEGDLSDASSYRSVLKRSDVVFHLAGLLSARKKEEYITVNVEGTRTLLEACCKHCTALKRFVCMSSIAAMGPRDSEKLLQESDGCNPQTEYGKSKLQAEEVVTRYAHSVPVVILRPSFIYGEKDTRSLAYLRSFFNQSNPVRTSNIRTVSFCYVSDVVQACMLSATSCSDSGDVFIISESGVYALEKIASVLQTIFLKLARESLPAERAWFEVLPHHLSRPKGSRAIGRPEYWGCDISKARNVLGFNPRVGLRHGAEKTIRWYLKQGLLDAVIHQ